jgi:hypothetical protein
LDDRVSSTARGTFVIQMRPGPAELDGAVSRFDFTKRFDGELAGTGAGLMLSAGELGTGSAGYVAIETVRGRLDGRDGGLALQQLGTMSRGEATLHYQVVPGSGTGELAGITGTLHLTVDDDGTHRYELAYELPGS